MPFSNEASQGEQSLADREARLHAILRTSVEGIITIDDRGIIISMNISAETLFDYTEAEMVGKNVSVLMPQPFQQEHDRYLANYLRTGEQKIIGIGREVVGKRRDGTIFPMHLSVSEVELSTGRVFTGFVHDLTERNRLRDQLIQSERLAAIGEVMAGLTHESRNALQRSQACLDLLEFKLADNKPMIELVEGVQRAQDELQRLYEGVLNYAAPIRLELAEVDLRSIVQASWRETAMSRTGRVVSLNDSSPDFETICEVDALAIKQVIRNIIENALQACKDPTEISVQYDRVSETDATFLELSIQDNGPGINPEQCEKVFDSFFTTKTVGTGLGLSVARRIMQSHGGEISAESIPGEGAKFVLRLPVKTADSPGSK